MFAVPLNLDHGVFFPHVFCNIFYTKWGFVVCTKNEWSGLWNLMVLTGTTGVLMVTKHF